MLLLYRGNMMHLLKRGARQMHNELEDADFDLINLLWRLQLLVSDKNYQFILDSAIDEWLTMHAVWSFEK